MQQPKIAAIFSLSSIKLQTKALTGCDADEHAVLQALRRHAHVTEHDCVASVGGVPWTSDNHLTRTARGRPLRRVGRDVRHVRVLAAGAVWLSVGQFHAADCVTAVQQRVDVKTGEVEQLVQQLAAARCVTSCVVAQRVGLKRHIVQRLHTRVTCTAVEAEFGHEETVLQAELAHQAVDHHVGLGELLMRHADVTARRLQLHTAGTDALKEQIVGNLRQRRLGAERYRCTRLCKHRRHNSGGIYRSQRTSLTGRCRRIMAVVDVLKTVVAACRCGCWCVLPVTAGLMYAAAAGSHCVRNMRKAAAANVSDGHVTAVGRVRDGHGTAVGGLRGMRVAEIHDWCERLWPNEGRERRARPVRADDDQPVVGGQV